jgi:CBS-domain-containing membrane protein
MFDKKIVINNLLSALGACICIIMLSYLHFSDYGEIWLIPPFGATMVLVMAVHNSPLAEPKNIFLGHTLSALSGVVIYALMGASAISLGIAVGLSVFVMTHLMQFILQQAQIQLLLFWVVKAYHLY